jgi:hypothetical protein
MKHLHTPQQQGSPPPFPSAAATVTTPAVASPSALDLLATASSAQKSVAPVSSSNAAELLAEDGNGICLSMDINVNSRCASASPNPILHTSGSPDSIISASNAPSPDALLGSSGSEPGTQSRKRKATEGGCVGGEDDHSSPDSSVIFASPSCDALNDAVAITSGSSAFSGGGQECAGGQGPQTRKRRNTSFGEHCGDLDISLISSSSCSADLSPNNSNYGDLENSLDVSAITDDSDDINTSTSSAGTTSDVSDSPVTTHSSHAGTLNRSFGTSVGVSTRGRAAASASTSSSSSAKTAPKSRYSTRSRHTQLQGQEYEQSQSTHEDAQKKSQGGQEDTALHALMSLKRDPLVQ